jgi:hypothetical protein
MSLLGYISLGIIIGIVLILIIAFVDAYRENNKDDEDE